MAGVRGEARVSLDFTFTGTSDLGSRKERVVLDEALALVPGTAATNEADCFFADTRALSSGATEDLDLAGSLVDAFGATITAAEVVLVYVKSHDDNTVNITVGAATQPFAGPLGAAGTYAIKPGEYFLAVSQSGWAVGAGATDDLKILAGAGAVNYDVLILGRTVAA
jgi:hypothetical protein